MVKIHVLAGNLEHYPLIFNVVIQLSNFKFAAIHNYITQRSWSQKLLWLQWKINNYYNHCKASIPNYQLLSQNLRALCMAIID